ncbi:BrnT family toxin [Sphingobium terrigena]|uniref:BrnT family toxin n=1 Tax=Sphingobium terrigena TaxID=2304063 RepID=A0A418YQL3_9SPHN|nr:BrnT family toxin [Sphingobium terrigena]RJG53803.1 BrnT family toxin [Sphingobium terrigena]
MEIEFDPAKDEINRGKRHVPLAFGVEVFSDAEMLIVPTIRIEDEEQRYKAIGLIDGRLWTVIYVMREYRYRFISVRKSNGTEQRLYSGIAR